MKKIILCSICFLSLGMPRAAFSLVDISNDPDVGEAGGAAPFLKTGAGARALAMGGAFVSVADDATASYWNPAGIAMMQQSQATLIYSKMSLDRTYNFAGAAFPGLGLGANLIVSGVSDIQGYDSRNYPTSSFDSKNIGLLVSYSFFMADGVSAGANLKGISSKIQDTSAKGFGLDFGMMFKPSDQFSMGLMFQDIYTRLSWDGDYSEQVPFTGTFGASYDIFTPDSKSFNIKLALDAQKYSSRDRLIINSGTEITLPHNLFVRAGVADSLLTAGFGVRYGIISLDYVYKVDRLREGNTSQFALTLTFGEKERYSRRS